MKILLQPLACGFRLGVALRHAAYRRGWLKTRRLNQPVISLGNLAVGGTGKTPLAMLFARTLLKSGWTPGILTRGYGRRRGGSLLALVPGSPGAVSAREFGDEPALLARSLPEVPVVIGANRYRAGLLAEKHFGVDVHLLDDGFQHLALARDLDVVLLDTTQELSDAALLPAGRLREPSSALQRAHWVVLTRSELADPEPLKQQVNSINPEAKVFCSVTKLCRLVDVKSGRTVPLKSLRGHPVAAFCGIGNPRAFFRNLRAWGFEVGMEATFPDHHVYTNQDLDQLSEKARRVKADTLLTTEKDAMNFPPLRDAGLPILACAIQTEIVEADDFEQSLLARLEARRRRS